MDEAAYLAVAPCVSCGIPFVFNPEKVPSIRVNDVGQPDPTGRRQPVCRACWNRRHAHRREHGLAEEVLLPGAYESATAWPEGGRTVTTALDIGQTVRYNGVLGSSWIGRIRGALPDGRLYFGKADTFTRIAAPIQAFTPAAEAEWEVNAKDCEIINTAAH